MECVYGNINFISTKLIFIIIFIWVILIPNQQHHYSFDIYIQIFLYIEKTNHFIIINLRNEKVNKIVSNCYLKYREEFAFFYSLEEILSSSD